MGTVLYYSKYCDACSKLLYNLGKTTIKKDIHFLNVDRRINENNKTFIGWKIIKKFYYHQILIAPALLLLNRGNKILFGKDVDNYFTPLIKQEKNQ